MKIVLTIFITFALAVSVASQNNMQNKVSVCLSTCFLLKKVFLALRQKDETSLHKKSEAEICPGF
jgi:hypothetical protein